MAQVWQLLRRNISLRQLIGYAASNLIGLSIVLTAVLFYLDSTTTASDREADAVASDYVVLSKRVTGIGMNPSAFTPEEIKQLQGQPWVEKVGCFTSSQFAVNGTVEMGGRGLSSYLFFESIPDEFFDIKPRDWDYDPSERFVPIVLSKDYLTLYNFGFAVPQGLPQLSEEIIGMVPIRLRLMGDSQVAEYFDARIVGFSSRLNTIAVPQQFMDWANQHFAPGGEPVPSRLIVKVNSFDSPAMKRYLADNEIEISGDKEASSQLSFFISVTMGVVIVVGLIICGLAIALLVLSIYLLLQKSQEKLRNLILLGYSPTEIGRCYTYVVCAVNVVIGVGAVILTLAGRCLWGDALREIDLGGGPIWPTVAIALLFIAAISTNNVFTIKKLLIKIWHS